MANPTSRATLIDYCKRKLGDPVIEINVDEDQLEDRLDEALQIFQEYHSEGTVRTFVSQQITADDVTNEYVSVASDILFVARMFAIDSTFGSSLNFFDIKYQMMLNDIADMHNYVGDLAYYEQMQQYLSLLDMKLNGTPQIEYSRKQDRLYIFGDFAEGDLKAGDFIVYEAYKIIDPASFTKVFNDMWLKEYTTALIKQQWGQNLIKFEGMQLPGGVTLNGRQIYDDATQDLERLREKLRLDHETPVDFFIG
mgnify:FL=1|jgi:hypothetical protein|tara:strand:+ start:1153 stop:1908 length:756 start_codon:yes stop_codon:yes gene_type:complete